MSKKHKKRLMEMIEVGNQTPTVEPPVEPPDEAREALRIPRVPVVESESLGRIKARKIELQRKLRR